MANFSLKRNDTSPAIQSTLLDSNGSPVNLTEASVKFIMIDRKGIVKVNTSDNVSIVGDPKLGVVKYEWIAEDTDTKGDYQAEWEVTFSDTTIQSFPNADYIIIQIKRDLG